MVMCLVTGLWTGCSNEKQNDNKQGENPLDSQEELLDKNMMQNSEGSLAENVENEGAASDNETVDLTVLSSTMVYGEVFNMMMQPESYMGKTVKMKGEFAVYTDETTGSRYYTCIIKDATACCAKGIEFELSGDYNYPDDYPEEGATITVQGIFDVYEEGGKRFCTLRTATMDI